NRMAEQLNQVLRERAVNVPALAPVRRAMLAEDAPAVGAAILPFSHFLLPKPNALWKPSTTGRAAMSIPAE
ncbi:MAG: sugar kinase, partial [Sphingomonas bacterium]